MSAPHPRTPLDPRASGVGELAGWCRLRVVAPTGAIDVSLPLGRTVADLVDELLTRLVPGAPLTGAQPWRLHRLGGPTLAPGALLAVASPVDGEVLHLTPGTPPPVAHRVDDALEVLGAGAATAGRWTTARAGIAVAVLAVAAGTAAALVTPLISPRSTVLPLAVGVAVLLGASLRRGRSGARRSVAPGAPVPPSPGGEVAALAALPAFVVAGLTAASTAGGGAVLDALLAGAGLALGAAGAGAAVPRRAAWWALPATAGVLVAAGGSVVLAGWLSRRDAAAVVGPVVLAGLAALPWLLTRTALWSVDAPGARTEASLLARGAATRQVLSGVSAGAAAVVSLCAVLLVQDREGDAVVLGLVLAVVVGLRARRSRFALESGALLLAGVVPLGVALARAALTGSTPDREVVLAVLAAVLAAALALLGVIRSAQAGETGGVERLTRARVRRALDVAEVLVAVCVVPLLAGVLGLYAAASDAGSQL